MRYQVLYTKEEDKTNFVMEFLNETAKDNFVETLKRAGMKYSVLIREDRKWQIAKCVFDLQLIDSARKAIKEGKDLYGMYTFGDPDKIAKKDQVVDVQLEDSRKRKVFVVTTELWTAEEIKQLKTKLNRQHLSLVVR